MSDTTIFNYDEVQISTYTNSKFQTYQDIKMKLDTFLRSDNGTYIIARAYSPRSALMADSSTQIEEQFTNDMIVYYQVPGNDNDIKNGIKDYLFIRISDSYLFILTLELDKTLNNQLEVILKKFRDHSIDISNEDLRQRMSWDNKE